MVSVHIRLLKDLSDASAENVRMERLGQHLKALADVPCFHARYILGKSGKNIAPVDLDKEVTRFVKTNDRFLALVSVLLKSQVFFESFPWLERSLVVLPRTKHRKPYIPVTSECTTEDNEEEINALPVSLSHQWPFAGISRVDHRLKEEAHLESLRRGTSLLTGFDVVVFDKVDRRLYATDEDFLLVFRDSFSVREWATITSFRSSEGYLQEFYIQWAVKEAYTKALGVGLGFDFSSFQVEWDDSRIITNGLWSTLRSSWSEEDNLEASGVVLQVERNGEIKQGTSRQRWIFKFAPLGSSEGVDKAIGAACACVGPFPCESSPAGLQVDWTVEWIDLAHLLHWHNTAAPR